MPRDNSRCPTCGRRKTRSHQANARYWLLVHQIAEQIAPRGNAYSVDSWHAWLKSRFLGCDELALPSGKTLLVPRSTASLDTAAFGDYMTRCEEWAGEHGVFLADIEEAA